MSHPKAKKSDDHSAWVTRLAIAFVLLSLVAAAGFGFLNYRLKGQQQQLLSAIENQKQTLETLKQREQVGERMRAAEILKKAQGYRINWSELVAHLEDELQQPSQINFNTVSVQNENQINVQAQAPSLLGVAAWLDLVNRSDSFNQGFVGSITGANQDTGTHDFTASFNYTPNVDES